jgi:hypothetical protein
VGATPDGNGGFWLPAWELGADGGIHLTISTLDTADHITRVACDPEIERLAIGAAASGDSYYLIAEGTNLSWQVAAVSRAP